MNNHHQWTGGRSSVQDSCGEYYATTDWEYTKILIDSIDYNMRVMLTLRINGRATTKATYSYEHSTPSKPYAFYVGVGCAGMYASTALRGPCRTIKDAMQQADAFDYDPFVKSVLSRGYAREHARMVFEKSKDGELTSFIALFPIHWYNPECLPHGMYEGYQMLVPLHCKKRHMLKSTIDRTFAGYSSKNEEIDEADLSQHIVENLPYWTVAEAVAASVARPLSPEAVGEMPRIRKPR